MMRLLRWIVVLHEQFYDSESFYYFDHAIAINAHEIAGSDRLKHDYKWENNQDVHR